MKSLYLSFVFTFLFSTLLSGQSRRELKEKLEAENNSQLIVRYFQDSLVKKVDTVNVNDSLFAYQALPLEGKNRLEITLTDQFGNQTTKETEIIYQPPVKEPAEDTISIRKKEEPPQKVINLLETLSNSAKSNELKTALENIDLKDQEIKSSEELFEYLSMQPIPEAELEEIVTEGANDGKIDIEDFRNYVAVNSEKNISKTIKEVDLKEESISTPDELMHHLADKAAESSEFTEKEIESTFIVDDLHNRDLLITLKESLTKYAYGDVKKILDTLKVPGENIQTSTQLYEYLTKQVEQKNIKEKDLQLILNSVALNGNPELKSFLNKLLINSEGELKRFLQKLDSEEMRIVYAGDLINYLLHKSETEKFTKDDVLNQISEIVSESSLHEEKITNYIALEKEKARNTKRRIYWGLSLILIVVIFFYFRKKRKNNE